mgnify:CR=1 FL=1
MKKILLVVLAVLVVSVFAMTACSKAEPTAEPTAEAAAESVEVVAPDGAGGPADMVIVTEAP